MNADENQPPPAPLSAADLNPPPQVDAAAPPPPPPAADAPPPPAEAAPADAPPPGGVVDQPTVSRDPAPAAPPPPPPETSFARRAALIKADVQRAQAEGDVAPLVAGFAVLTAELIGDIAGKLDRVADAQASPETQGEQIAAILARLAALEAPRDAAAAAGIPNPDGKTEASARVAEALNLVSGLRAGGQISADTAATLEAMMAALISLDARIP